MSFHILGISTAVPEHVMTQDDALAMSSQLICRNERETRLLRMIFRRAGVQKRHTCVPHQVAYDWVDEAAAPSMSTGCSTSQRMQLYAEHAGPLAIRAAADALCAAGVASNDITHLITASCTGFDAPGADVQLIEQLGLPKTTERLHIGYMGCHGALNGLRAARGLIAAEPNAKVLLCAVELCSLHYQFQWDDERILGNALFADGAAALVGTSAASDGPVAAANGSRILDGSRDAIAWRIGDHGFEMTLSNEVPQLIRQQLRPWLAEWLARHNESFASIRAWAVHPGGPRILDAVEGALQLAPHALSASRAVLKQYGNMSSPTILFILKNLLDHHTPRPYVALGFGPGLTVEAALIR